ncbi:E3 ubiquitin-protein ligase TRIM71-like [Stylophora pistillata]|uniref:E3 ubiquitin-protein ligase TRIM71-like n=2 Tax=Stylophora pistillata TaxID=50429 RepID=UPI000C051876|nr:E3 ubiquitin-protein ligase TRIM71-like [Stylophora pistillata]
MEIKINGQKLSESPFVILVKARELKVVGKLEVQGEMPQGPVGIAVNSKGVIAVADHKGHCIRVFDETGKFVRKLSCQGEKAGQLKEPVDVTFLNDEEILVADVGNNRIQQLNVQTGNFVKSFGKKGRGDGELKNPGSVCITSDRRFVVVTEYNNSRIKVFSMDGEVVLRFGDSGSKRLDHPLGCACYEDKFIVSDSGNNCVKVFDGKGKFLYKFGEKGNGDGRLDKPWGICIDKYGSILVCEKLNNRIQMFTLEGAFMGKTSANLNLQWPWAVTTMPDDRILITDFKENEVYILK